MEVPSFIKKMNLNTAKGILIVAVIIFIIYVLVEFGGDIEAAVKSILTGLGLEKPAIQQQAEATIQANSVSASTPNSPWSPQLYQNNPDASTLDYQTLVNMADSIYGSRSALWTWLVDSDASLGFTQIKMCNNKIDVSNLVVVFQQEYQQDLLTFMEMNYTSAPNEVILQQIITFVNNLPNT
jgi:hypothetical protein